MHRYSSLFTIAFLGVSLGINGSACSSAQKTISPNAPAPHSEASILEDSSLEITYELGGKTTYRFKAKATGSEVSPYAQSFSDKQLLKEGVVDKKKYSELFQKTINFINAASSQPTTNINAPCRAPFALSLQVGTDTKKLTGCRSQDHGSLLSRITREAEFLLYSKN